MAKVPLWDQLLLEPYGGKMNVTFYAIVPENHTVLGLAAKYFAEVSSTYSSCKLGEHRPAATELLERMPGFVPAKTPTSLSTEACVVRFVCACLPLRCVQTSP